MNPLFSAVFSLQKLLGDSGISSAVIGGIAVSVWGRPRATEDVDLKVLLRRDEADRLIALLHPDYVPLNVDPRDALRRNGVLFVRDSNGIRLDLQLADVSLDESVIARARSIELAPGLSARVCTAEDLILYKMISTRKQDQVDVENVIRRQGNKLDDGYVVHWLQLLGQALDLEGLVSSYRTMRATSAL